MEHNAHVVLDQDNGEFAVPVQEADQPGYFVGFLVAHARRRFIEQQQPRPQRQRHRDLGGALAAMGEFADQPVRFVGEPDQCQRFGNDLLSLFSAHGPHAQMLAEALDGASTSCTVNSGNTSVT